MGWDKEIPFEQLSRKLMDEFKLRLSIFVASVKNTYAARDLVYTTIALIQLYNGLRAGEAVEAFEQFINSTEDSVRSVEVKVEKRKDGAKRKVILDWIPINLNFHRGYLKNAYLLAFKDGKIAKRGYINWFKRKFNINTHTLRKAFETYVAVNLQADPTVISAFQGRKNLQSHLAYIRASQAQEKIRELFTGISKKMNLT